MPFLRHLGETFTLGIYLSIFNKKQQRSFFLHLLVRACMNILDANIPLGDIYHQYPHFWSQGIFSKICKWGARAYMESMPWILDSQVPRPSCELGYLTRPWMNIWEWGRSRYSSGEISTNNILAFQPDACMLCHQHPSFPNSSTCLGHYCAIYL